MARTFITSSKIIPDFTSSFPIPYRRFRRSDNWSGGSSPHPKVGISALHLPPRLTYVIHIYQMQLLIHNLGGISIVTSVKRMLYTSKVDSEPDQLPSILPELSVSTLHQELKFQSLTTVDQETHTQPSIILRLVCWTDFSPEFYSPQAFQQAPKDKHSTPQAHLRTSHNVSRAST